MKRRSMSTWLGLVGLSLALVLSGCASSQTTTPPPAPTPAPPTPTRRVTPMPPLRIGMAPNYPPVIFKEQGRLTGLEVDFANRLGEELGRSIELVELPWEGLIPALESGEIAVIMSGMSVTEGRKQRLRFVQPYMRVGQMAIIRKESRLDVGSPSLLARTKGRVGFVAGTTGAAYVQQQFAKAQHVPVRSTDEGLQALRTRMIDAFIHDAVTAWRVGSNDTLTASYFPLTEEYLAWAVAKENDLLGRDLGEVLGRWQVSGELQALLKKWLTFPPN